MLRSIANAVVRLINGYDDFELFKFYFSAGAYPEYIQSFDSLLQTPETNPELIMQALAMRGEDGTTFCMRLASFRTNERNLPKLEKAVRYCLDHGIAPTRILELFALENIYGENLFHRVSHYQYAPMVKTFYKLTLDLLNAEPSPQNLKLIYGMLKKRAGSENKPQLDARPLDILLKSPTYLDDYAAFLLKLVKFGLTNQKFAQISNTEIAKRFWNLVKGLPAKRLLPFILSDQFATEEDLYIFVTKREELLDHILQVTGMEEKSRYLNYILDGNHILGKLFRLQSKDKSNQPAVLLNEVRRNLSVIAHQRYEPCAPVRACSQDQQAFFERPPQAVYPTLPEPTPSAPALTPETMRKMRP